MAGQIFIYERRVAYADCTVGNHIYHSRYLDWLECCRGEFFRHLETSFLHWQEQDIIFPVIEANLLYRAPARYDDLLRASLWITELRGARLTFGYDIKREDNLILEAVTRHVCTSTSDKPTRLPEALISRLQPYLTEPGDRDGTPR